MKCERCGHDQPSGNFCDGCGMRLTLTIPLASKPGPGGESAPGAAAPAVARCRYCGHQQAGGRFCDGCGMMMDAARVAATQAESSGRCPLCATPSKTRICGNCGVPIPGFPEEE